MENHSQIFDLSAVSKTVDHLNYVGFEQLFQILLPKFQTETWNGTKWHEIECRSFWAVCWLFIQFDPYDVTYHPSQKVKSCDGDSLCQV